MYAVGCAARAYRVVDMVKRHPFTVEHDTIVVRGGFQSKDHIWVVKAVHASGKVFVALRKGDRSLARALGLDLKLSRPWQDNWFLDHLRDLRNAAVDTSLVGFQRSNDELGDAVEHLINRHKVFTEAEIASGMPVSVEIEVCYDSADDESMSHFVNCQTTMHPHSAPCIELTDETLGCICDC